MLTNKDSEAIEALDLIPIKRKLMHVESGEGWTHARAEAVEAEYRRFLCLVKKFPNEQIAPTVDVDTFWHYHILDTMKYAQDCDELFGHFLHHDPNLGLGEHTAPADQERAGQRMQALYAAEFGDEPAAGAAGAAAWCTITQGGKKSACCTVAAANTAWCTVTAARSAIAWCTVTAAKLKTAWCTVAAGKAKTAWCTVTAGKAKTAWCTVTAGKAKTAWCTVAAGKAKAAWCTVATGKAKTAWCTVTARKAKTAWCTVSERKAKAAWCTVAAGKAKTAWCTFTYDVRAAGAAKTRQAAEQASLLQPAA